MQEIANANGAAAGSTFKVPFLVPKLLRMETSNDAEATQSKTFRVKKPLNTDSDIYMTRRASIDSNYMQKEID